MSLTIKKNLLRWIIFCKRDSGGLEKYVHRIIKFNGRDYNLLLASRSLWNFTRAKEVVFFETT